MQIIEMFDLIGLGLWTYRLWPRAMDSHLESPMLSQSEKVSIIIPARNEEANLPRLLQSLQTLDYPDYEVIVVDDQSTDKTLELARSYPVMVIEGRPKPEHWHGKTWACHQGVQKAKGKYFVFTDADTVHHPFSLKRAISRLKEQKAQGLSALPYHENPSLWERGLGPFQCLLLALTHPYQSPRPKNVFSIGQYLLFDAEFYKKFGGHEAIREEAIDDLSLANLLMKQGGTWTVWYGSPLFQVRMYASLSEFIKGWRRNFRGGYKHSSAFSGIEATLFIMALTAFRDPSVFTFFISFISLGLLIHSQKKFGRYSVWGVLFFPFSLLTFIAISLAALFDKIVSNPLVWKDRSYAKG